MPLSVLLVDDDPAMRYAVARGLAALEPAWTIHSVGSGPGALDLMAKDAVDVLVTDLRMRGMDGADLAYEFLIRYPWVVRIVVTAMRDVSSVERGSRWSERYLTKPCAPDVLRDAIVGIVSRRDQERQRIAAADPAMRERTRILMIADDAEGVRQLRAAMAEADPATDVVAVADGASALSALTGVGGGAEPLRPALILLDVRLPVMTGWEFLARHRQLPEPGAPVVVIGASDAQEARLEAIRHGAAACMVTPATWDRWLDLASTLSRYAQLGRVSQASQRRG